MLHRRQHGSRIVQINNPASAGPHCLSPTLSHIQAMTTLFDSVELAPRDPILGLNEQYNADTVPTR